MRMDDSAGQASGDTIRLGLLAPLSGLVGMYGEEIIRAASIACDEVNAEGGVLGLPLELVSADDGSFPASAVPAALGLVDFSGCAALIGNLLTHSRIAVADKVAGQRRVPYLNFAFYAGGIASRYFFHFSALPNQQIDKMIAWAASRLGQKMFFAGNNYEWPRGSIDAAKRALIRVGGEPVGEVYLPFDADAREIDAMLDEVRQSGADVFVPYFAGANQIAVLKRFAERGLKRQMAAVMGHFDDLMASLLPEDAREGLYGCNTYFMSVDTARNRRLLAALARRPGVDGLWPQGNGLLTNFGEGAYLCVHAFAQAARAAGSLETDKLLAALEYVIVNGPQGTVVMDAASHHAAVSCFLAQCGRDGGFRILERFGCHAPMMPERYVQAAAPVPSSQASPRGRSHSAEGIDSDQVQQILTLVDMAVLSVDEEGVIIDANPAACEMFAYTADEMAGMPVHQLLPPALRQPHAGMLKQFIASGDVIRRMASRSNVTGCRKDGSCFPLEISIAKFRKGERWTLIATLHDVSVQMRTQEELLWSATHDALTGLANRALLLERLERALQRSRRTGAGLALLFVDLDNFKLINDTHGHGIGDQLIQAIAARLLTQLRPGDTVARFAGDEFVVLCEQVARPEDISALAERINAALREEVRLDGLALGCTASIGIAIGSGRQHLADDLLRAADIAMHAVKQKGRDGWRFFNDSLHGQARQRFSIIQGLRSAIEREELHARYQPIVDADGVRVVGAELLLRWHAAGGEIPPAQFIPIAESCGAIVAIGYWVFRQACLAEADWRRRWGADAPYVSVNLSARQLDEARLADEFGRILRETGAAPARILLEVTETALMADIDVNLKVLQALNALGLRVAVDDFGTGYSSLAQLTRLPVEVLKIDRAFVDGIGRKQQDVTLIRAIIGLGKALGLKLVAEGVESGEQLQTLRQLGCDLIQGYLFHRPMPLDALQSVVERSLSAARDAAQPCQQGEGGGDPR
ncbi:Signal transduction histidine kinase NtrB, nitrogen specific [Chromobacterium violaceum]|uniref:EAL domain-containing protein n=1 Tax=Chromobacterium violaceum TaxID=536 RepID=UPI003CF6E50F